MKSIKSLIEELNLLRNSWEYKSLSLVDEHITALENRLNNLEKRNMKYYVFCGKSSNQAIPSGILTAIIFNYTHYPQFGNMHDNAINPEFVHIRRSGVYTVAASAYFSNSILGTARQIGILLVRNGLANYLVREYTGTHAGAAPSIITISTSAYLYAGDSLYVTVYHDGGAGISVIGDLDDRGTHFAVMERMEDLNPSQYGLLNPEQNMR